MTARSTAAPDLSSYATQSYVGTTVNAAVPHTIESGWRPGRQTFTNFAISAVAALKFNIANANYITDSGRSAVEPTADNAALTILTKDNFRNAEIRMRYRFRTATPHTSSLTQILGRYLDGSNYIEVDKRMNPAAGTGVMAGAVVNGSGGTFIADNASASRDQDLSSTTPRILRVRIIDNFVFVKSFLESAAEPDWQVAGTVTHNSGVPDYGAMGVLGKGFNSPSNIAIFEVSVTELLKEGENLYYNATGSYVPEPPDANTSMVIPLGWTKPGGAADPASGNAIDMVSDTDPWGNTRPVFRVKQATNVGTGGGGFYQDLNDVGHVGNTAFGTARPGLNADFDCAAFEFSVWSKGISIDQNSAATIGSAAIVFYIYDVNGNILQGLNDGGSPGVTFLLLGPNTTRGPSGGTGTWGWYKTTTRIRFDPSVRGRIYQVSTRLIFHDGTGPLGGEFRFCNPFLRASA